MASTEKLCNVRKALENLGLSQQQQDKVLESAVDPEVSPEQMEDTINKLTQLADTFSE